MNSQKLKSALNSLKSLRTHTIRNLSRRRNPAKRDQIRNPQSPIRNPALSLSLFITQYWALLFLKLRNITEITCSPHIYF